MIAIDVVKQTGLLAMFLLFTSAVIPEFKLRQHNQMAVVPIEMFDKQYKIERSINNIELMKSEVRIVQKEISINMME